MKSETIYIQFTNTTTPTTTTKGVTIFIVLSLFLALTRAADGMTTPTKDMPLTMLKTGSRTYSGLQSRSISSTPIKPIIVERYPEIQNEMTEDESKILAAILKKTHKEAAAHAAEAAASANEQEYNEDEDEDYYEDDEDDDRCPEPGEIYFEKSGHCVPRKCQGGTRRDLQTGFCHKKLTGLRGWSSNSRPYYYRSSPLYSSVQRARIMYPRFRG